MRQITVGETECVSGGMWGGGYDSNGIPLLAADDGSGNNMPIYDLPRVEIISPGQVLNYGAAITAVGGAVLLGVAALASAPELIAGGVVYGVVSGALWLASSMLDVMRPPKAPPASEQPQQP